MAVRPESHTRETTMWLSGFVKVYCPFGTGQSTSLRPLQSFLQFEKHNTSCVIINRNNDLRAVNLKGCRTRSISYRNLLVFADIGVAGSNILFSYVCLWSICFRHNPHTLRFRSYVNLVFIKLIVVHPTLTVAL